MATARTMAAATKDSGKSFEIPEIPPDFLDDADTQRRESTMTTMTERAWNREDVTTTLGLEAIAPPKSSGFTRTVRQLKIFTYLVTFCIVLTGGVISKVTLLLMTSLIDSERRLPVCNEVIELEEDHTFYIKLSVEERWSWIWCILGALFIPEVLTLLRCSRLCIFKNYKWPTISSFFIVLLMETLHTVGVILLVFTVFPKIHVFEAICLTNAVGILPSMLNVYYYWNQKTAFDSVATNNILNIVALFGQLTVFVWLTLNANHENFFVFIRGGIGVILVSCSWWENYVNVNSPKIILLRNKIEKSRPFIYAFVSLWKMALMFSLTLAVLYLQGNDVKGFLDLPTNFLNHTVFVMQPGVDYQTLMDGNDTLNLDVAFDDGILTSFERPSAYLPLTVCAIHIASSYLCYSWGKFACKICIQGFSYALPVFLTIPVAMTLLSEACDKNSEDQCFLSGVLPFVFWECPPENVSNFLKEELGLIWVLWILSQWWLTVHLWKPKSERMASTNNLFVNPLYSTVLIDQSLALNRRKNEKILLERRESQRYLKENSITPEPTKNSYPKIYACATMWHETQDEMELLLQSIMRLDAHQCSQKIILNKYGKNSEYYELEAHIIFDDAFVGSGQSDGKMTINSYVKKLIEAVNIASRKVHKNFKAPSPPKKFPTPYGGRLEWKLLGENALIIHLKNKEKIRHKKRWSQVMYMFYLLGYNLRNINPGSSEIIDILQNTFILALDGDIDFKPKAVTHLVDLMKRNKRLGAACGRIHPVGSGLMVYYQKFEYAIGHWLQKSTEHMIGCVLCSPGCFSLFRAEALVKNGTIRRYATKSMEAIEYVQFDQGEDRWLCSLFLQVGFGVDYSAASDAYTHCPETFAEFYTQRRRWAPSTMANIMDLIVNYKKTVACNENISRLYIAYQVLMMIGTILGPGTIFLMLVGAMVTAFKISTWQSFVVNLVPIIAFIIICFKAKNRVQILVAQILSALYALLMMAVMVGMSRQLKEDGATSPSAIFLLSMTASFVVAALAHPQEFWCVVHGIIYFLSVPSMYLLLALYSFINLHVVSWGTREVSTAPKVQQISEQQKKKSGFIEVLGEHGIHLGGSQLTEEEGGTSFGLGNMFQCMCCTHQQPDPTALHMHRIERRIDEGIKAMNSQVTKVRQLLDEPSGSRRRPIQADQNIEIFAEGEEGSDENDALNTNESGENLTNNHENNDEFWLTDKSLSKSETTRLCDEENEFWTQLIEDYLQPLKDDPEEKAKATMKLLSLRNTVVVKVLMLNALFILIVLLLQMQKDALHLEWPLSNRDKANITYIDHLREIQIDLDYLKLEPINLVLVFFFTLILVIQFVAMLFHRLETLSHILASTNIFKSNLDDNSIDFTELTDNWFNSQQIHSPSIQEPSSNVSTFVHRQRGRATLTDSTPGPSTSQEQSSHLQDSARSSGSIHLRNRHPTRQRSLSVVMEWSLERFIRKNPKFQACQNRGQPGNPSISEDSHQEGIEDSDGELATPITQQRSRKLSFSEDTRQ